MTCFRWMIIAVRWVGKVISPEISHPLNLTIPVPMMIPRLCSEIACVWASAVRSKDVVVIEDKHVVVRVIVKPVEDEPGVDRPEVSS